MFFFNEQFSSICYCYHKVTALFIVITHINLLGNLLSFVKLFRDNSPNLPLFNFWF